ncbi:Ig-like domain-containing protein [Paenibacillus hodogayensis]|uniref:Ig-like domain-containing protein n=1 Tax=Paenibacillus hodogayensis TaxID=279208 RepID=A0ABV5VXR3_9BACL
MKSKIIVATSIFLFLSIIGIFNTNLIAKASNNVSPNLTVLEQVYGRIFDFNTNQFLYLDLSGTLKIVDRNTKQETVVAADLKPKYGYLHLKGAIFVGEKNGTERVYDWRNGNIVELEKINSSETLKVAGKYATYSSWPTLLRTDIILRDLDSGTNISITAEAGISAGNNGIDINSDGEIVYWSGDFNIQHYSNGVNTSLTNNFNGLRNYYPKIDKNGSGVIFIRTDPCCYYGAETNLILVDIQSKNEVVITPLTDTFESKIDINDGWIAYSYTLNYSPHESSNRQQLVIRSPSGEKQEFIRNNTYHTDNLVMGNNGEVIFRDNEGVYLAKFGSEKVIKLSDDASSRNRYFQRDGVWYFITGGSLYSVNTTYVPVQRIYFDPDHYEFPADSSRFTQLIPKFQPEHVSNWDVEWSSTDHQVAKPDRKGLVEHSTGSSGGTATVTAKTVDGGFKSNVTFDIYTLVREVNFQKKWVPLEYPQSIKLNVNITPADARNQKLIWSSSNTSVATVDQNGNVQAVSDGSAIITVTSDDGGFTDTAEVSVFTVDRTPPVITSLGVIVSGVLYPAIIDKSNNEIIITLPKIMYNSGKHILTNVKVNASRDTDRLDLTVAGQRRNLFFNDSNGNKTFTTQEVFGVQYDPNNNGIPICQCQQIIKQFPQVTGILYDYNGNQSMGTYTIKLNFE